MLVIEGARRLGRMPAVMLVGLTLMVVAGVLDVALHLGTVHHVADGGFASQHAAHLLGIAGMALVLVGVVRRGALHHHRRRRAATHGGPERNAHR